MSNALIKSRVVDILHECKVNFNQDKLFVNADSLRLTWYGNKVLSEEFKHHIFQCNMAALPTKLYEGFSKMTMPYYVGERSIVVYSDYDAFGVRIYDSVEDYLKALVNY